ncbi:Protein of unknown function [Cyclobacterium xiamenense]|uniref:DUF1573 domain-containing protein n=2 Tax=Cyclobacterium xiamenense TaxID=1297121 RepID=A0A1H6TD30_9BACT|nr:Protein of unknown function [Cyclobacterium xiamenense]
MPLFARMKRTTFLVAVCGFLFSCSVDVNSQDVVGSGLVWENSLVNIGAVLAEDGPATADFYFVNKTDSSVYIRSVETDCGCTVADYSKDSLAPEKVGLVKVRYDPQSRGGTFSKLIIVRSNAYPEGDSLFLEGVNVPYPKDPQKHYGVRKAGLGFVFPVINLGTLFTDAPKTKFVDFYNFNDFPIQLSQKQAQLPEHIAVEMIPSVVPAGSRAVFSITYDAALKKDLGFVEDAFSLSLLSGERMDVSIALMATIHEHFDPIPVDQVDEVPRLNIAEREIDLGKISSASSVSGRVSLENTGPLPLNLRKVVSNCDCLEFAIPTNDLDPGEEMVLVFTFDPKGRRGIDHKTLTFFSNDPLNPTQTVVIKSRID